MALDAELINLKSAGTYRFERDLSTISNDTTAYSNLRLIVGFSKTGPFNTPNLVTSQSEFIKLYGNIDRSLEKKGSYFHRSALVALNAGQPILCLNLVNLDPDKDQVQTKTYSVNSTEKNKKKITLPVTAVYNTDKFWYTDAESFMDGVNTYLSNLTAIDETEEQTSYGDAILHFTNVGKRPISILVKKASSTASKGYELTLKEWYGEGNVPEYLNSTSFVSDYLVEVYVVAGDFGPDTTSSEITSSVNIDGDINKDGSDENGYEVLTSYTDNGYARFSSDLVYQDYFDEKGFIRRDNSSQPLDYKLNKFLNLSSVNLLAKYVGSLIPNFVDKLGKNIWIVKQINDNTNTLGLVCTENVDLLESVDVDAEAINEKIDLIGHNIFSNVVESGNFTKDSENNGKIKKIDQLNLDFLSYKIDYKDVLQTIVVTRNVESDDETDEEGNPKLLPTQFTYIKPKDSVPDNEFGGLAPFAWYRYDVDNDIILVDEPKIYTTTSYITPSTKQYAYTDSNDLETRIKIDSYSEINPLYVEISIRDDENTYYTAKRDDAKYTLKDNEVVLDGGVVVGDYLVSSYTPATIMDAAGNIVSVQEPYSRLTRVVEVRNLFTKNDKGEFEKSHIRVICADKIFKNRGDVDNMVVKITPIDNICDRLQWTCLKGFQMRKELCPDGTNERQNQILDMLRENPRYESTVSNLYKTLCDRDYIQWRYLVDTFGYGIEEECKSVYTLLCQGRKSAFAIINCPSQSDFKKSYDPSFINKSGGVSVEYIANGGDRSKNPQFLFSLPTADNGASWGAYYYPYLRISDLSAVKTVPPAAYVSNLYIQKYNRANAWSIVAGQKRGVISGNQVIGVEATLVHENRDFLEPVGINSIIWENGVGVEIYANKTAKQTPKSALSSIHVREACIFIQDNVESILRKYVFEYNTAQTRLEIKTLVDDFLETVKNNSGIYDYKTIMDTSNNTPEVIDNNMGIIDIFIEPVRGLEILAQRLKVLKTGALESGSFE